MNRTSLWAPLALAAVLAAAVPSASANGNCSNYGFAVNTYVMSSPDCSSHNYTQYCDQGTGAGAGAGAGSGAGGAEAEAEATAGTRCTQSNGSSNQTESMGGPLFDQLPTTPIVNGLLEDADTSELGKLVPYAYGGGEDEETSGGAEPAAEAPADDEASTEKADPAEDAETARDDA